MKHGLILLVLLTLSVYSSHKQARDHYLNKNYSDASTLYQELVVRTPHNFSYLYNYASSLYRLEDPVQAKLYYLKALKVRPNDSDTKFNISLINKQVIDQQFLFQGHWVHVAGVSVYSILIAMIIGSAFVLMGVIAIRRRQHAEVAKRFSVIFLFIWLMLVGVSVSAWVLTPSYGVVMSEKVQVFSGPSKTQIPLFYAHEGAEFKVIETTEFWVNVQFPNGLKGWLLKDMMAHI